MFKPVNQFQVKPFKVRPSKHLVKPLKHFKVKPLKHL